MTEFILETDFYTPHFSPQTFDFHPETLVETPSDAHDTAFMKVMFSCS
jgi:hypothetical protein